MISIIDRVEKFVGIEENAGHHQFLLVKQCFH